MSAILMEKTRSRAIQAAKQVAVWVGSYRAKTNGTQ